MRIFFFTDILVANSNRANYGFNRSGFYYFGLRSIKVASLKFSALRNAFIVHKKRASLFSARAFLTIC
ncbi:MAG: hypothetical protein CVU44_00835 [Chloroflexi bacterium HGW-Chloroflexi-6]|nr:MAG: hypothetical protein CVU44_00835 [Chloroflexi bacterium HGW-Chloroflexi-6]